jgi:hypothetical protein
MRSHVFVAPCIIEVLANDVQCLAACTYPRRECSRKAADFACGNDTQLASLDAWPMRGVWSESQEFSDQ